MKLPTEAISEYQSIYQMVFGNQITDADASLNAEMLLSLIFSLENTGYKVLINKQKNGTKNHFPHINN